MEEQGLRERDAESSRRAGLIPRRGLLPENRVRRGDRDTELSNDLRDIDDHTHRLTLVQVQRNDDGVARINVQRVEAVTA